MIEEYSNGYARGYEAGQQSVLKLAEQPAPVAEPRKQEPVAWMNPHGGMLTANYIENFASGLDKEIHNIPLYTSPPAQRTWVGLTDEDIDYLCELAYENDEELILTVQAKLKEKNT